MQFDYSQLQSHVSFREFYRALMSYGARFVIGFYTIFVVFLIASIVFFILLSLEVKDWGGYAVAILFSGMGAFTLAQFYVMVQTSIRLSRFAGRNGLTFLHDDFGRNYSGTYFTQHRVRITDGLRTSNRLFYEFGNISMLKNENLVYGYLRIKLPRPLPHIMLHARKSMLDLPEDVDWNQHLSLEGDFDKTFELYAPKGYERDALYLFTPDVMAKFVDTVGRFNCEIVDDELYIFSVDKFELLNQKKISSLLATAKTLTDKIDRQFGRYSDDRLLLAKKQTDDAQTQASQISKLGRRLETTPLWMKVVAAVVSLAFMLALVVVEIYYSTRVDPALSAALRGLASVGVTFIIAAFVGFAKILFQRR